MCKMRNKHLKQLKGKEGTAKKCLLERRKLNLNQVLLVLQKNKKQNLLLYTAQEPQCKTREGKEGANKGSSPGRAAAGAHVREAKRKPGLTQATSTTTSLPTAMPPSAGGGTGPVASPWMGVTCSHCNCLLGRPLTPTFWHPSHCCTPSASKINICKKWSLSRAEPPCSALQRWDS